MLHFKNLTVLLINCFILQACSDDTLRPREPWECVHYSNLCVVERVNGQICFKLRSGNVSCTTP